MAAPNDGTAFGSVSQLTMAPRWSEPTWTAAAASAPNDGSAYGLVSNLTLTAQWPYPVWPAVA